MKTRAEYEREAEEFILLQVDGTLEKLEEYLKGALTARVREFTVNVISAPAGIDAAVRFQVFLRNAGWPKARCTFEGDGRFADNIIRTVLT